MKKKKSKNHNIDIGDLQNEFNAIVPRIFSEGSYLH